ncbi:MAG: GGDEF domain-containing protein [Polyangiaceae bacterium]|nr:GGDEF domain-containing protein [Polyangiaceae bacterium]
MRRRRTYTWLGLTLAMGSPAGLLILRAAMARAVPSPAFVAEELTRDPALYAYAAASTSVVLALAGHFLGRAADRLESSAFTDVLTGLCNRRNFEMRLEAEFSRGRRYGTPVSVILIDMDGLKAVNDRWGHAAGDMAIKAIAGAIRETCRATDLAARLGGDEFAVLAAGVDAQGAFVLAERLRVQLAASPLDQIGRITVSLGIAEATPAIDTWRTLLKEADAALYESKHAGRNRTSARPIKANIESGQPPAPEELAHVKANIPER